MLIQNYYYVTILSGIRPAPTFLHKKALPHYILCCNWYPVFALGALSFHRNTRLCFIKYSSNIHSRERKNYTQPLDQRIYILFVYMQRYKQLVNFWKKPNVFCPTFWRPCLWSSQHEQSCFPALVLYQRFLKPTILHKILPPHCISCCSCYQQFFLVEFHFRKNNDPCLIKTW